MRQAFSWGVIWVSTFYTPTENPVNTHLKHLQADLLAAYAPTAKIISSGIYLPERRVLSDDLMVDAKSEHHYGIPHNFLSSDMGIIERRVSSPGMRPSELAIPAAKMALENAPDINPDHIDMIIFCGIERDRPEPATAHTINRELGLSATEVYDKSDACLGFMRGIQGASRAIRLGDVRLALVVTGEITTRLTYEAVDILKKGVDLALARDLIGFLSVGDAGGAVIMGQTGVGENVGFIDIQSDVDSSLCELCYYDHNKFGEFDGRMKMARIVAKTLKMQRDLTPKIINKAEWKNADYLLTHQVGKKPFKEAAKSGMVKKRNMIKSYDYLGNLTSSTFPVNFHQLQQVAKPGDKVYGAYSGSGAAVCQFAYVN